MSRKRKNKHQPKQPEAVPDEVLAEGSGPHGDEAVEAAAEVEAVAAIEVVADDAKPARELPVMDEEGTLAVSVTEPETRAEPVAEAAAAADELAADGELIADELAADDPAADEETGATLPTSAATMDGKQLKHLVEALVFASDKPVTLQRLRQLTRVADVTRLETALAELAADFADRGLILQQVSGGYQFRTQTRYSGWVQQLIAGRPVRLSRAQLETLAIIAYRQPITRPEIDEIRGVDSSGTLKVLLDRALVRILGKREEVGRPMLYGTTKEFLDFFSLGDLRELPTLREYSELTPESKRVMTDKLGAAPEDAPAAAPAEQTVDADELEAIAEATSADPDAEIEASEAVEASADEVLAIDAQLASEEPESEREPAPVEAVEAADAADADPDDELADPALLAEAAAVARALSADHEDVDTEIVARDEGDDLEAAPPLDPSDDLLAEPDPTDEILD